MDSKSREINHNEEAPTTSEEREWIAWYQATFSNELSLITSETLVTTNPARTRYNAEEEAIVLRRRLRAVDAIESLSQQVECSTPISHKLWEFDAPECRACKQDLGWTRLRRRHHCRYCGLTFCDECTPGEIRRCTACHIRQTRFEAIKVLRGFEREVLDNFSREGVLSVARAYRAAIQSFSSLPGDSIPFIQRARSILIEGMHSFLELTESVLKKGVA